MTTPRPIDSYQHALSLLQSGDPQAAIPFFERAIAESNPDPEWIKNLGNAWRALGEEDRAEHCYRTALKIDADHMPSHNNLALILRAQGALADAEIHFRHALRLAPQDSDILTNLAVVMIDQSRLKEARPLLENALQLNASDLFAWQALLVVQRRLGQAQLALESIEHCLALAPETLEYWLEKADLLGELRQPQRASLDHACALSPDDNRVQLRLGMLAIDEGRYSDALPPLQRAKQTQALAAQAHYGLGKAHHELGDYPQAKQHLEASLQQDPRALDSLGLLLMARLHACDWNGLAPLIDQIQTLVAERADARLPPFMLLATGAGPEAMLDAARKYTANVIEPITRNTGAEPYPARVKQHPKIRLGYLSGDFREHPLARLVAELFELHNRERFELYGYCYSPDDGSAIRQRLIVGVDHFCSIRGLDSASAAARIHQDEIDILIDLTGYTGDSRTEILALRPAPVQVSYLGYLATSGSDFVDYIIADAQTIPHTQDQFYSEKVVRLPFYQVSDRSRKPAPRPTRQALGLPQDAFIYCCFNQPYKITPQVFARWMNILRAVPGSVLWLYAFHPSTQSYLAQAANAQGIDSSRLLFAPRVSMEEHLGRMAVADLFLDTSPYNAGATASDALWAGLPVLTCPGTGFASRMCASLLGAAGIAELITGSPDAYQQLAIGLAQDRPRLKRLSEQLNSQRAEMALFDCPTTVAQLESAFTRMQLRAQQQRPPEAIEIQPTP